MNHLTALTRLRSIARKTGLIRVLSRVQGFRKRSYEERFSAALLGAIRPGDTVWDIGANLGLYTEKFATIAGPFGRVVAFEPVPCCFQQLEARVASMPGVVLHQKALGSSEGVVPMAVAANPLGATHSLIATGPIDTTATVDVPVSTGDTVLAEGAPAPTIVKIDVEGFEAEVVAGMRNVLSRPACRAVFIEVHFGLLEKKGTPNAPAELVKTLRGLGFHVRWVDPSHLEARR